MSNEVPRPNETGGQSEMPRSYNIFQRIKLRFDQALDRAIERQQRVVLKDMAQDVTKKIGQDLLGGLAMFTSDSYDKYGRLKVEEVDKMIKKVDKPQLRFLSFIIGRNRRGRLF